MQNNQNSFKLLQNLIVQISNHVYQINEIIIQMNNIVNQMYLPNFNQMNNLMGQMNNFIGNQININQNFSKFNDMQNIDFNNINDNFNDIIYVKFIKSDANPIGINIDKNKTIEELLDLYLKRNGLNNTINNYIDKLIILYNGESLLNVKEKKIREILENGCTITVEETGILK